MKIYKDLAGAEHIDGTYRFYLGPRHHSIFLECDVIHKNVGQEKLTYKIKLEHSKIMTKNKIKNRRNTDTKHPKYAYALDSQENRAYKISNDTKEIREIEKRIIQIIKDFEKMTGEKEEKDDDDFLPFPNA